MKRILLDLGYTFAASPAIILPPISGMMTSVTTRRTGELVCACNLSSPTCPFKQYRLACVRQPQHGDIVSRGVDNSGKGVRGAHGNVEHHQLRLPAYHVVCSPRPFREKRQWDARFAPCPLPDARNSPQWGKVCPPITKRHRPPPDFKEFQGRLQRRFGLSVLEFLRT